MNSQNDFPLIGVLIDNTSETTKNGKQMTRLIIEVDPPRWMRNATQQERIPIVVFGRAVNDARDLAIGQVVSLRCRAQGREYNGKWYSSIVADEYKAIGVAPAQHREVNAKDELRNDDDVPF